MDHPPVYTYEITLVDNDETIIADDVFMWNLEEFLEFHRSSGHVLYMIAKDQIKYVRNLTLVAEDIIHAQDPE